MSQITTHILDTSAGKPAQGVEVRLDQLGINAEWKQLSEGISNADGRVSDLLSGDVKLSPGIYRITFETGKYFSDHDIPAFYPEVKIIFETTDRSHYHVPLLLNPYGYSTYRGS